MLPSHPQETDVLIYPLSEEINKGDNDIAIDNTTDDGCLTTLESTTNRTSYKYVLVVIVIVIAFISLMGDYTYDLGENSQLRSEIVVDRAEEFADETMIKKNKEEDNDGDGDGDDDTENKTEQKEGTGSYTLIEAHEGESFFDYYNFIDGPDTLGSAGYNTYVGRDRAEALNLIQVQTDDNGDSDTNDNISDNERKTVHNWKNNQHQNQNQSTDIDQYVVLSSTAGSDYDLLGHRFRESIRLESKRHINHGLIVLDVQSMPSGCGVWPAFWTANTHHWPQGGEIDIVEPINQQRRAKTALHTSKECDMYAHVPRWNWTGSWDTATGIPDTFTGTLNYDSQLEADNCWTQTPHQWENQGCVAVCPDRDTIGAGMNKQGGGIYVLEWDPQNGSIKSWVFPRGEQGLPQNLKDSLWAASQNNNANNNTNNNNNNNNNNTHTPETSIQPDPSSWPTPYAFFAIGKGTGCSSDHFHDHQVILNLAFCGAVAGNRFQNDCPALYEKYNVRNDSLATCQAYLDSDEAQPLLEQHAFWKIKGVYLFQRE